jgi:hypothetical protein
MNFRTTLLLLILVAGGVALYWYRPLVAEKLGLEARPATPDAGTLGVLEHEITADRVRRVEVVPGNSAGTAPALAFERTGKVWSLQPGAWPARKPETEELIALLTELRSRFEPIPVTPADLKQYGLAPEQHPVTVKVTLRDREQPFTLTFGEPPTKPENPFVQPTYLRLDEKPEVVRLGPGLLAVLKRPKDDYQKRQLFPEVERVRFSDAVRFPTGGGEAEAPPPPVTLIDAKEIDVTGPDGKLTLKRQAEPQPANAGKTTGTPASTTTADLARRWELDAPVKDRVDPEKLKTLLTAVPDVWVEQFVSETDPAKTGLDKPERQLKVAFPDRDPLTLLIGKVSRVSERKLPAPPPANPFSPPPPPPPAVREEFRYAKLPDNPQVFEVKADKFADLFVKVADLRDPRLARFRPADVTQVAIDLIDHKLTLTKEKEANGAERWKLKEPLTADAEASKVTELLDKLSELQAQGADVIDTPDPKPYGLDPANPARRIVLTVTEEKPAPGDEKEKVKSTRTVTFKLGKDDVEKGKLYLQVAGVARVDAVKDDLTKLIERPALAYRARRVLDVAAKQIAKIDVQHGTETFELKQDDGRWEVGGTKADAVKASSLANDLGRLEAVEYVNDAPKPDDLKNYGLDTPALTATLTFTDPATPAKTVQLGKPREGKPEVYAKLADAPAVFAVRESVKTTLDAPALAYRPLELWQVSPGDVTALEVQRGPDAYKLARAGAEWKISGPFDATAQGSVVGQMLDAVAAPRAERYEAAAPKDLAAFGLDKPALRVSVTAGPTSHALLIGKPTAGGRFAKLGDGGTVFVIGDAIVKAADRPALDLLDRTLLTLDPKAVTRVQSAGTARNWTVEKAGDGWKVSSLQPPAAADKAVIDGLVRVAANLRAVRFAAYGPKADWKQYGLDRPDLTVTVTAQPEEGKPAATHTVAVGRPVEAGVAASRFARIDNGPGVAILPASEATQLSRSALDFVDHTLLTFDAGSLAEFKRTMAGQELDVVKKDGDWSIVKPSAQKADAATLDELAERLAHLRATRVAALGDKDLASYGLDKPAATVTLKLEKDGQPAGEKVLHVSGPLAGRSLSGDERFVRVEGVPLVAVLPAGKLLAEPLKFRDRPVARFADADRATFKHGRREVTFAKVDGTWKLTRPVSAEAEQSDLDDLVNAVARLRADELVAEKATDLKQYGLDPPEAEWRFFDGEKEVLHLMIGSRGPDGRVFARRAGGDLIVKLDAGLSAKLLAEYRKRAVLTGLDAAGVETLVVNADGKSLVLQKANNRWEASGQPGRVVNESVVTDLLAALAGLKAERFVADQGADLKLYGLDPPVRTVVARGSGGTPQTLYLGNREGGSKRVYARTLEGKGEVFVLSEADSAKLMTDLSAFTRAGDK